MRIREITEAGRVEGKQDPLQRQEDALRLRGRVLCKQKADLGVMKAKERLARAQKQAASAASSATSA